MRLGFVGCGRWASRLAESFRACGTEIVAHDRSRPPELDYARDSILAPGFGQRIAWRDQLADKSIDAIIAVAPPEITTEVALACAAAGKPVLATKPLLKHPDMLRGPLWVDLWRLFSRSHAEAKRYFRETEKAQLDIDFYGSGPIRSFPGALDYGPHVLAAMLDIEPELRIGKADCAKCESGELFRIFAYCPGGKTITANFGNGATESRRQVRAGKTIYLENGSTIGDEDRGEVMRRFCRAFMNDVAEGFVDSRLLELSRKSAEHLNRIREMAV